MGTELVKYTDERNKQKKSTKLTIWNRNAINKRCIHMQTLEDNYAQKESEKQTHIIAWHSIMAKSCVSLFFVCSSIVIKLLWIVVSCASQNEFCSNVRMETPTLNVGMTRLRSSRFRVDALRADLVASVVIIPPLNPTTIVDGSSSTIPKS